MKPPDVARVILPKMCVIGVPGAPEGMEDKMRAMEIHDYARKLLERRGASAIAEAAQKAADLEKEGQAEDAANWRHISDAMRQMRRPHQS